MVNVVTKTLEGDKKDVRTRKLTGNRVVGKNMRSRRRGSETRKGKEDDGEEKPVKEERL